MQKTEKQTKKKGKKLYTHFGGGLENGQEVVPPFFSQKKGLSKSSKTPIFIVFPEKWVAVTFSEKGRSYKEETFRGAKANDHFWGKSLRSHQKGGWGMREAQ